MPSNELETIAASIQDALHRAYEMGRSDALRRVVQMVQEDELGSKTVALLSHSEPPAAETPHPETQQIEAQPIPLPHDEVKADKAKSDRVEAVSDNAARSGAANAPWWADREREERRQVERASAPPASIGGFLKDFLYPLGGKK